MMDQLTANVAIGGNLQNVLNKTHLTIPEIVMLRNIHGQAAVFNIKVVGTYSHDEEAERDRLGRLYDDQKVQDVFGQYGNLPKSFEEARIDDGYLDALYKKEKQDTPKKKTKTSKKRARDDKGHFIADDPTTEKNEAFVEVEEEITEEVSDEQKTG